MKGRNHSNKMNNKANKSKKTGADSSFWGVENQQLINFFQNGNYLTLDSRNESGVAELISRYEEIDHPVANFIVQLLSAIQLFSEQSNPDMTKVRNAGNMSDQAILKNVIEPLDKALTSKEKFVSGIELNEYEQQTLEAAVNFSVKFISERFDLLKGDDDKLFHVMQKSSLPLKDIIAEYQDKTKKSVLR